MKWWLIFPLFVLVLVQSTITSFNLLLVFILVLSLCGLTTEAVISGFMAGLLLDILTGGILGRSSLGLLSAVFISLIYQQKFQAKNPLYWLVLFILGSAIFNLITGGGWQWVNLIIFSLSSLPLYWLFSFFGKYGEEEGIHLRV